MTVLTRTIFSERNVGCLMSVGANEAWLVINTQPNREAIAVEHLQRQEFEVYCPLFVKRIRHARKAYDANRPLFPGYVFTLLASERETWRPILGTYGVRSIVRSGATPAKISGSFVAALRAREVDGAVRKPESPFVNGQTVAVRGGSLDGLVGQILELRDNERVLVLLNFLNQQTKVHLSIDQLDAA